MTIISRAQWGARAPRQRTRLAAPARGVVRHYEGVTVSPYGHGGCAGRVRNIQAHHMDRLGWDDIAYSFIVCRHGEVFEGRWAHVRTAANGTKEANASYYAGCILIGPDDELTPETKAGWLEGRNELRRITGAGPETPPHSQMVATPCPGGPFRDWALDGPAPAPLPHSPQKSTLVSIVEAAAMKDYTVEAVTMFLPTIRQGSSGQHVKILQGLLTANGRPVAVDGSFGGDTAAKLKEWQGKCGLAADGICGPVTWRRLLCI